MHDLNNLAFGRSVLFAQLQHYNLALALAERIAKPGKHLVAPGRVERAAEHAVLNVVESVVLAHVCDLEPDAITGDVIDDHGEEFLSSHRASLRRGLGFGFRFLLNANFDIAESFGAISAEILNCLDSIEHELRDNLLA